MAAQLDSKAPECSPGRSRCAAADADTCLNSFTRADLDAIFAYLRSIPPVSNRVLELRRPPDWRDIGSTRAEVDHVEGYLQAVDDDTRLTKAKRNTAFRTPSPTRPTCRRVPGVPSLWWLPWVAAGTRTDR